LSAESGVGRVYADCLEDLGVFAKAVPFETALDELAPVFVAAAVVEHRSRPEYWMKREKQVSEGIASLLICLDGAAFSFY